MSDNLLSVPQTNVGNPLAAPPDPYDFSERYNTRLTPDEERQFQRWVTEQSKAQKRDMSRDVYDYDLRGFWKSGGEFDEESGHGGDKFKKPNHPTFSTGSQYHGTDGYQGGLWGSPQQKGQPWTFTPSKTNLEMMPLPALQRYFASPAEAGRSVLVLPDNR